MSAPAQNPMPPPFAAVLPGAGGAAVAPTGAGGGGGGGVAAVNPVPPLNAAPAGVLGGGGAGVGGQPLPLNAAPAGVGGGGVAGVGVQPPPLNAAPAGVGGGGVAGNAGGAPAGHDMENLMESSGAQRHQVAFELIHRGSSTTWNDSMRPFRDATARPDNANAQTLMGSLAEQK